MTSVVRADILGFVARYPGVHVREVERQLGLSSRLASYHLGALEAEGLVRRVQDDGYARFVSARSAADVPDADVRLLCVLRRPPAFRIVGELLRHGEVPQNHFAKALGLAKASVSYHLKALLAEGVVAARVEGRERHYRLAAPAQVRRVLREFEPLPGEVDAFSRMLLDLVNGGRTARP